MDRTKNVEPCRYFRAKSLSRCFCVVVSLLFGQCSLAVAQTLTIPSAGDKELYISALHFVAVMYTRAAAKSDPAQMAFMQTALCREMDIDADDLQILVKEAQATDLAVWKGGDNAHQLREPMRSDASKAELTRLKQKLSSSGWAGFDGFVNGPFRKASFTTHIHINNTK